MMDFDGKEVAEEFKAAFGKDINEISVPQMRWMTKIAKHCRGRCRSNVAFNNYMNRNFRHLMFKEVMVPKPDGTTFPALDITAREPSKM
jgi:hypothetical protein